MKMKRIFALLLSLLFAVPFVVTASAAGQPSISLESVGECAVGDTFKVKVVMKNAAGFAAGDFHIQYNPYMVRLTDVEECSDVLADKQINYQHTPVVKDKNAKENGLPVHTFNISIFHVEHFTKAQNNMDLFILTFEAVGGGDCPIVLGSSSVIMVAADGSVDEVYPKLSSADVVISGEEAESWDYQKNVVEDVIYTDEVYTFAPESTRRPSTYATTDANGNYFPEAEKSSGKTVRTVLIIVAAVAVVGAVAAIIVFSSKGKYIKK